MRPNSIKSKVRRRRTICNLTSDICLLISVRCPLSITSALGGPGNPPKCGQNLFMQNKPNFQTNRQTLTLVMAGSYNEKPLVNPKITNPIKPNTNPIGKRPKINANFCHYRDLQRKTPLVTKNNKPKQTQTKPNTNPKTNQIPLPFGVTFPHFFSNRPKRRRITE